MRRKQQRFIEEYPVDCNATQAALRAGYSANCAGAIGSENLQKPEIRAAIDAKLKELAQKAEVDAVYIRTMLRLNAERAMQAVPVTDRDGNETGEYKYDGQVANRALELLGKDKAVRMFVSESDITSGGEPIRFVEVT